MSTRDAIREFLQNEFILEILLKYDEVYCFTFTPDFPGPLVGASFTYNAVLTHLIAVHRAQTVVQVPKARNIP